MANTPFAGADDLVNLAKQARTNEDGARCKRVIVQNGIVQFLRHIGQQELVRSKKATRLSKTTKHSKVVGAGTAA